MRVALFSSTIDAVDGDGNITLELTRHLHERGTDLTLFLPASQKPVVERLSLPFPVRCELPPYIYRIFQWKALGYLRSIDVSGFDLVHDLFAFPHCLVSCRSAAHYGKPYVIGAPGADGGG